MKSGRGTRESGLYSLRHCVAYQAFIAELHGLLCTPRVLQALYVCTVVLLGIRYDVGALLLSLVSQVCRAGTISGYRNAASYATCMYKVALGYMSSFYVRISTVPLVAYKVCS